MALRQCLLGITAIAGHADADIKTIVIEPRSLSGDGGVATYESLVGDIHAVLQPIVGGAQSWNDVAVVVDSANALNLSALSENGDWEHFVALLILTFPEIRWSFAVTANHKGFPHTDHDLAALSSKPRREPLFDPTGLREWVKQRTAAAHAAIPGQEKDQMRVPARVMRAASIDEERDYTLIQGYAAFRYGFRCDAVTSWTLMESLFGSANGAEPSKGHGCALLLEDMRLNFPDKPAAIRLSRLAKEGGKPCRADYCGLLDVNVDESNWRFLITTGQAGTDTDLLEVNSAALQRKKVGRGSVLYKPVGGMIDLWEKTGLVKELGGGTRAGNAPGFTWPPPIVPGEPSGGHGAPGKLTLVATTLLARARPHRQSVGSVGDFILGAVLALEAAELVGGKTPTLTLDAVAMRQEFEVRAEAGFVGAGFHFGLRRRLVELDAEVTAITRWFHEKKRRRSALDAKAQILNRLAGVFREAGLAEEDAQCLTALRRCNRTMMRPRNIDPAAWISHGVLSYGEWLLASFTRIPLVTVFWIVLLTWVAWRMAGAPPCFFPVREASDVAGWFFGSTASTGSTEKIVLSWICAVTGVFHLGVLISYLYSLIARK